MSWADCDQAGLVGGDDQLGAVACLQLGEQVADVGAGGGVGYVQAAGDFGVGKPAADEGQHLAFAAGDGVGMRAGVLAGSGRRANSAISRRVTLGASRASPPATSRMAVRMSAGGLSLSRIRWPGPQRGVDVFVEVVGGEDDDPHVRGGGGAADLAGRLDPVQFGHPDVHEDKVGLLAAGMSTASAPVAARRPW